MWGVAMKAGAGVGGVKDEDIFGGKADLPLCEVSQLCVNNSVQTGRRYPINLEV